MMKVEIRRTPNGPWEPVAGANCSHLSKNAYRVTLPMHVRVVIDIRLDGIEAQSFTDVSNFGGPLTLAVTLKIQRFS